MLHVSARDYYVFKRAKQKSSLKEYHKICSRLMKRYMMLNGKATVTVDCRQIILYQRKPRKKK